MPISYYLAGAVLQFILVLGIRFSYRFILFLRNTGRTDSVTLQSEAKRSKEFLDKLQEPTAEMMKKAREYRDQEEARRLEHRVQILPPS